jgi:hypothetical protein
MNGLASDSSVATLDLSADPSAATFLTAPTATVLQRYIIAQQFDQDVMGDIRTGFNHFVDSGQVWALLIGLVLGYLFRSITA